MSATELNMLDDDVQALFECKSNLNIYSITALGMPRTAEWEEDAKELASMRDDEEHTSPQWTSKITFWIISTIKIGCAFWTEWDHWFGSYDTHQLLWEPGHEGGAFCAFDFKQQVERHSIYYQCQVCSLLQFTKTD
jgi:hypothetical protein